MKNRFAALVSILALSACVTNSELSEREEGASTRAGGTKVFSATESSMEALSKYGAQLYGEYLKLADRTQTVRDATTIGLIAYAADAAADGLGDASAANLGRKAIAGTAFSASTGYLNPATATGGLFLAAKRSLCLSNISATANESGQNSPLERTYVIDGFARTQLDVRNSLRGIAPDYSSLATGFSNAVKKREQEISNLSSRAARAQLVAKFNVEEAVKKCLLTGES